MSEAPENRESPLARQVILLVCFVALVVIAVWTVLVPALEDRPDDPAVASDAQESDPE